MADCFQKSPRPGLQQVRAQFPLPGMADCFQKMSDQCYSKCVPNVKEASLSAGEQSCTDRCVNKYLDVHQIVGKELQNAFAAQGMGGQ